MNSRANQIIQRGRGIFALAGFVALGALVAPVPAHSQDTDKLTLHQAVTLALQNSRDVKLAQVQYNVALGEVGVDRAAFRPNLYTGAGAAYTHGFPALPGGQAPSLFELDYTQALFNPLLKGEQHAAEDRAKNQKLELDRVRDDVIVRTATAYLELAEVRHSLELMLSEQASGAKILQAIRERVAANQELPIEVTRTQLALARISERVVKSEDRDAFLDAEIRDLTGISDGQSLEVEPQDAAFSAELATAQSEGEIESLAIQNDRSVAEAENERAARQQILKGVRSSYFPTVELVGQYSVLSNFNNYLEFYKKFERNNVNVGVQVTIPLFAAKTSANVALAKSQFNEAELLLGNKRQQVRFDVQQKARSVRELDASREVARIDLQLAQETLQSEQAKFDQNRITLQEIEQARLEENDKWVAFLDADFARQQAQLTLLQATGQLAKVFQ
ncbi:MAG TPA: TolC family protein [Candidatus Acidoferrales bacterium]|nr:TolC family protein [Candidatus Acidoferrales bacterium]